MPRSKKNKRAANASEGGKPDQESVMEDQAADELNSMEEEVHKQEAHENEEDNQNGDLNGNNASNGHDLDEAEEGVKNAAKKSFRCFEQ